MLIVSGASKLSSIHASVIGAVADVCCLKDTNTRKDMVDDIMTTFSRLFNSLTYSLGISGK